MSDRPARAARGFTLLELLVVIALIAVLLAILSPSLSRVLFMVRSRICGANKHQLANALCNYALDNDNFFPARYPKANTYNHAYWFGRTNSATLDLHEQIEQYVGSPVNGGPPSLLLCTVAPTGIWGTKITWPLGTLYRSNVIVYAGYDWATTSANCCVPQQPIDQMPLKLGQVPHRPLAGDLVEYMSGNSASGFSGWDTSHSSDQHYHNRAAGGPEAPPPDPIPFAYGDGSVRFASDLEPCYTDQGWGTNYWPVPE